MRAHTKGMLYDMQVRQVGESGFTAEAVILEDCGDSWLLREIVGSADALLDSRKAAEDLAGSLARDWIEKNT